MLEWKILAAAFSALLVISILLVGNNGLKDLFGGIVGKITDWMGETPIQLPGGKSGTNRVTVSIYPNNFTLKPETKINFSLGESYFENFNGEIFFDFVESKIYFQEKGSSFKLYSPFQHFEISDFKISKLSFQGKFTVVSEQSTINNENSTIEIKGFSGALSLVNSSLTLEGNVTKITGNGWNIG